MMINRNTLILAGALPETPPVLSVESESDVARVAIAVEETAATVEAESQSGNKHVIIHI